MEKRRLLAVIMTVMMVISLLPSMVFASAPSGELAGKLKIKGLAAVGTTLSADYSKAEPAGLTDDDVTFQWLRKAEDAEGAEDVELGTDKTYVVTEEDLGSRIILKITGKEELALKGSLTAKTLEVSATEEEAKLLAEQKAEEQENSEEEVEAEVQDLEEENSEGDSAELPETEESYMEIPEDTETSETEEPADEGSGEIQIYSEDEVILNGDESDADSNTEEIPENLKEESEPETGYEENAEEQPEETESVPSAEVVIDSSNEGIDFGTVTDDQEAEPQYAEISNTGNTELHFLPISPEHFMVADISEPLAAGQSTSVWVVPREGLEPGQYEDTIQYSTEEGVVVSFTASATVEAGEQESATEPAALSADPEKLSFTDLIEGYDKVEETQTVTITNIGKQSAVLQIPQSSYFVLTSLDGATEISLDAGAAAVFSVQPVVGLVNATYNERLTFGIQGQDTGSVSVQAQIAIQAKQEETVISAEAAPSVLEKYSLKEGYKDTEPQTVTVTNTGNTAIVLKQPEAEYFSVGEISADAIAPGEYAQFTVRPAADLVEGFYNEEIQILGAEEDAEPKILTNVLAQAEVEKAEETVYAISASPSMVDFGKSKEGYEEAPKSQKVTVTNEGTENITLEAPKSTNFKIGQLSQEVIAPGESSSFNIRPKTGLTEGLYVETILIPNNGGTTAQVDAQFEVTAAEAEVVKVTGIQNPSDIEGIKNGAEKSVDGLKLPSYVIIKTTAGKMKAAVKWNVSGCEYNPASKDAQTFKVNGTVVLPEKVQNPDGISLITSVKVTVGAGYTPKKADPADNKITGIESTGYTTQSKITFTAVGAGMENTSPRKGDERYLPTDWKVINTNSWQEAPYTATFGITKGGTYTLTVNFAHQKFDGKNWTSTGQKDAKQVNFTIDQAQVLSPTATPIPGATNQRNAVLTGDETNIMIFVVILVIAVGGIAGVLVYKKKRK